MVALTGCVARAPAPPSSSTLVTDVGTHVVQRDDTLYRIALRHGLDWRDVARRNAIAPPYLIYPGQRLRLAGAAPAPSSVPATRSAPAPVSAPSHPPAALPTRTVSAPAETTRTAAAPTAGSGPAPSREPAAAAPVRTEPVRTASGAPATDGQLQWQWPADGPVLRAFSNSATTRRGIAIGGRRGDPVRAAAGGEVVYAGSGLVGYGRLIIIKHDGRFISAYGHNEELLVREGERVQAGQRIAQLGDSGADRPLLHFEIRVDGAPVDPTRHLPRR